MVTSTTLFFLLGNSIFLYMILKEIKEEKIAQKEFEKEQCQWGL
jgi:hypothetical protein